MKLTADQVRTYFETRLADQKFARSGENVTARCPLHDDRRASLSFNPEKNGAWKCFAGCGQGSVVDFEKLISKCDDQTAIANIAEICGLADQRLFQQKPEAVYQYRDEDGRVLFEKLRFPGKRFVQRATGPDGRPVYKLDGIRRVLYRLQELITANAVAICEGEKDADNVNALDVATLDQSRFTRFAATTNFDGAGKWRSEYSPYLAGKHVFIFPDHDEPGRVHAQQVAASVFPYVRDLRIVELPGLEPKGDVSDFLKTHTAADLLTLMQKTPVWKPSTDKLLIPAPQFLITGSDVIDWDVESLIQRGSNGFIGSLPKVGKSWIAVDLALALALAQPWLGFNVPRQVKTALVTREDNPKLTKWRMKHLLEGRCATMNDLGDWLYVNSREQSAEFLLDKEELLGPMIAELKTVRPQFVILDVFNILHAADENDNTEMRVVMAALSRIQREVGCSLGVVHHFNKNSEGTLTQKFRGAGAIAGWAEWLIGLESVANEKHMRKMEFQIKAGDQLDPFFYEVHTDELAASTRIQRVDYVPEQPGRRRRAEEILAGQKE
jgi:putative DNA primase/helicase